MKLSGVKVLITGADGFIGSHLVEALLKEGASIRAMSFSISRRSSRFRLVTTLQTVMSIRISKVLLIYYKRRAT